MSPRNPLHEIMYTKLNRTTYVEFRSEDVTPQLTALAAEFRGFSSTYLSTNNVVQISFMNDTANDSGIIGEFEQRLVRLGYRLIS